MSDNGYIYLERKILENWIWKDKPFSKGQAWIDLLLLARWKEKPDKTLIRNQIIIVNRGELIYSKKSLSDRWGWSVKKVSNYLQTLKKENQIALQSDNKTTYISIVNYNEYQLKETQKKTERKPKENQKKTEEGKGSKESKDNNIDIYLETFNKVLGKSSKMNNSRKTKIKNFSKNYSVQVFGDAMQKVIASDFLQYKWTNWSFDWFMNEANFTKLIEGTYDNAKVEKYNQQVNSQYSQRNESKTEGLARGIDRVRQKYANNPESF